MQRILVWDLGIRLFHWLLVAGFVFSYISIELFDNAIWHAYSGWFICVLLIFRLLWGVIARPRYASFAHMLHAIKSARSYAWELLRGKSKIWLGHNPLGALSAAALLLMLALQTLSGLFLSDDVSYDGPLYAYVPEWIADLANFLHETVVNLLLLLIALHLAAIAFYSLVKKQRLVPAMLTGIKELPDDATPTDNLGAHTYSIGFILHALAALLVTVIFGWYLLGWIV